MRIIYFVVVVAAQLASYSVAELNNANLASYHLNERSLVEADDYAVTQTIFHDFEFTRSLRDHYDLLHQTSPSDRRLADDGTCSPTGDDCTSQNPNCCQGGCNSNKKCFCQANGGTCFSPGGADNFCCSNMCNSNGKCSCIAKGQSCDVGGGYCCDGLMCGANKTCILKATGPTRKPTKRPSSSNDEVAVSVSNCKANGQVCTRLGKFDASCCSERCGFSGKCVSVVSSSSSGSGSSPTRKPTRKPNTSSTSGQTNRIDGTCEDSTKTKLTVEIKTDRFGDDLGWSLSNYWTDDILHSVKQGTYGLYSYDSVSVCVPNGLYNFTLTDLFGDGVCCKHGEGHVKVKLNDRDVIHVRSYSKFVSDIINVGYDPSPEMSDRDIQYLEAHNRRRYMWYTGNGVSDVPLRWSPQLAEESRVWAQKLLVNCSSSGIEHEHGVEEGENLAKNKGSLFEDGVPSWGQLYPPDNIVGRWVEFEVNRPYPGNAHLTQALWRGSKYMGCGEAQKEFANGMCRIQVCRYARAGNCDMSHFNATTDRNWLPPMLDDTSRCGPNCPPEGCY
ncbi:hypothetical protein ACHAXH_004636 [Discostella pseudostelligera]